jgi:colanic acid biosynthesis glycosyl transferase WcaI
MSKRVLLIGGNFYPELTGIGKYNGEMVDFLAKSGYECTVITSYPYYPFWKIQEPYCKKWWWYRKENKTVSSSVKPITIYRCPQFVPQKPSGSKRMLLDFSFCLSCFLIVSGLLFKRKYDYIITVAPSFQIGLIGLFYKWLRRSKHIYHIQDLQIDAARDLKMIKSRRLLQVLLGVEKFIIKKADIVSSISTGMIKRIKAKHEREIIFFPNWVDTKKYIPSGKNEN